MLCMILNFWISLTDYLNVYFFLKDLDKILSDTPPVWKGSSRLFRNLNEKGENTQQANTCIYLYSWGYLSLHLEGWMKVHRDFESIYNSSELISKCLNSLFTWGSELSQCGEEQKKKFCIWSLWAEVISVRKFYKRNRIGYLPGKHQNSLLFFPKEMEANE